MADGTLHAGHPSAIPLPARQYQGRRAGVVTRVVANAVDLGVVIAIVGAIYAVIAATAFLLHPRSFHWPTGLGWSIPVIGFVVLVPYLTLSWCMTGRTYGDALLGLRVVNYRGERMRIAGAALRAVACTVFPIGVLWIAISPANRSLQDLVLRTSVIYDWTPRPTIA
jgi:uncharacterized RDD family membrane protein YckC